MTIFFNLSGAGLDTPAVRRESLQQLSFSEAALAGMTDFSGIIFDDPGGTRTIPGHAAFHAEESACPTRRLYTGWTMYRTIKRNRYRVGASRVWDTRLMDLNAALGFRIIDGEDGKRPHEQDIDRVAWLLGSDYMSGLAADLGEVAAASGGPFNEADYRNRYPLDVLASIAPSAVRNFFLYYDETVGQVGLYYQDADYTGFASTLRISNDLADYDGVTTFAPSVDAELLINPENVYSGVRYDWGGGILFVQRQATIDAYDIGRRDAAYSTDRIGRLVTAQINAASWLEVRAEEDRTIRVPVELPASKVNLIQRGHRVEVKFTHLPGFESFAWSRVARREVRGSGKAPDSYIVTLDLTTRIVPSAPGGGGGVNIPWQPPANTLPSVVQSKSGFTTIGDLTITLDSTPGPGDLLVCMQAHRDVNAADIPAGFTPHPQGDVIPSGETQPLFRMSYRVVQTGDPAAWDLPGSGVQFGFLMELAGVATLDAWSEATGIVADLGMGGVTPTAGVAGVLVGGCAVRYTTLDEFLHGAPSAIAIGGTTEIWDDYDEINELYPHAWGGYQIVAATSGSYEITGTHVYVHAGPKWAGQSMFFTSGEVAGGAAPQPGQWVYDEVASATPGASTTAVTVDYGYRSGSLRVKVDGVLISNASVVEDDPAAGTFHLTWAVDPDETVTVSYQGI